MLEFVVFRKKVIKNMILILVKYYAIIICSFYIYLKLLHIDTNKKLFLQCNLFLVFFLPVIFLLRKFSIPLTIFIIVIVFAVFISELIKTSLSLSLTTSTISFGLAYLVFLIATAIVSTIGYFFSLLPNQSLSDIITLICIIFFQFLLTTILFKIKRLQKGMPFLIEYGTHDIGVYISILLLFGVSFFDTNQTTNLIYIIPAFLSLACGLTLLVWWRKCISKNYIEKIKAKETDELQKNLQEKNTTIEQLKYHNNELSKIIHKDNKLIPAMEYAVREFLLSAEYETDKELQLQKAKKLLEQLECMTKERAGILKAYEYNNKTLPATNVSSIDTLMSYMLQKSSTYEIDLDLSLSGSVIYLIQNMIDESDLKTLLADLIDNAIIATKKCVRKNILVHIGISNDYYSIDIFDSGEPFTIEALQNIGCAQFTTHQNEGGSGIGLMSTSEISKKYQASFIIEELDDINCFTKNVSICFDNLGQYRIKSNHVDYRDLLSQRNDIVFIDHPFTLPGLV